MQIYGNGYMGVEIRGDKASSYDMQNKGYKDPTETTPAVHGTETSLEGGNKRNLGPRLLQVWKNAGQSQAE